MADLETASPGCTSCWSASYDPSLFKRILVKGTGHSRNLATFVVK